MRRYQVEVATEENWERLHRVIRVRACSIRGALKRAIKKMRTGESVYQICTRVRGCELNQPVWDFFNGNIASHFGLKLGR